MVELAIAQLREVAGKAWAWARKNPWPVFLMAAGLLAFLWVLIRTILLDNMGFQEKTFWDWMDLLLVPTALALAGLWFSRVQKQTELEIAQDRQRQNTMDAYLDEMTELVLEKGLGPDADPEVKKLARTRTIIALRSLDSTRNRLLIQFLRESKLIHPEPVVDLRQADLSGAILVGANLRECDLRGVVLREANLAAADLSGANLSRSRLNQTDLEGANLRKAILREAHLGEVKLGAARLGGADLSGAFLTNTELWVAELNEANLSGAHLYGTNLRGTELNGVNLEGATLTNVNLDRTYLEGANLLGVKFIDRGKPIGARFGKVADHLLQVRDLRGATMPDGTKYKEWIKRQEAEQGEGHEQSGHT